MLPSEANEHGRWPYGCMLWVQRDVPVEQVELASSDLVGAVIRDRHKATLVISIYVEGKNEQALLSALNLIKLALAETKAVYGDSVELLLLGDSNRHDQLWGRPHIHRARQGEAAPIIEFMNDLDMQSLLPRGNVTWENHCYESTIDLVLGTTGLADGLLVCKIHDVQHGSDHRAIETVLENEIDTPS